MDKRIHETTDDDSDLDVEVASSSKRVCVKRKQTFLASYSKEWPCLLAARQSKNTVHCTICKLDFSCAHGGRNDCERHVKSKSHKNLAAAVDGKTQNIATMFKTSMDSSKNKLALQITQAEAKMCQLICDSNLSLSTADRLSKDFKLMFPDSKIAQGIQCGRAKATAMIKEMSALTMAHIASNMKERPYSLATDGGNGGDKKQFPLVVRTYGVGPDGLEPVNSQLLAMRNCSNNATGANIFKLINDELAAQGIPWTNCIAFGCDNAPVMTGGNKGVISFIVKEQPTVFLAGCPLHLVHIAAQKGAGCLPPIDKVLIDIFYYFKKSTLRQTKFKELQLLYDVDQHKMLKHGCTRWLSIARCVKRLLDNCEPLKQYFDEEYKQKKKEQEKSTKSQSKNPGETTDVSASTDVEAAGTCGGSLKKLESISTFLRSPMNKLFTAFLNYTVKVFDGVLVKLQGEAPLVHEVRCSLVGLIVSLYIKFMKPEFVRGKDPVQVSFLQRNNQKDDEHLLIGDEAKAMLGDAEKLHLRPSRIAEFFTAVRCYFEAVVSYLLKKLPFEDPLLKHARIVDPQCQSHVEQEDLAYFVDRFPALLPSRVTKETLYEELALYQVTDLANCRDDRADVTWINVSKKHPQLLNLTHVMLGICTIPHSSAACERVFSCVRKTITDQRSCLGDDVVESLLVVKSREASVFNDEELGRLKSSYALLLKRYKD